MANLKEIRVRIGSIKSTQQITSAMKMVAASKLRRAQDRIIQMRPYSEKLHEILGKLVSGNSDIDDNPYIMKRNSDKVLIVAINSNKGLCGGFNSSVIKTVVNLSEDKYKAQFESKNIDLITIGRKANEFFKSRPYNIIANEGAIFDDLTYENSIAVSDKIMELYASGTYKEVIIVYNQFKNAASQILCAEQILPIESSNMEGESKGATNYIYDPDEATIIEELIPKSIRTHFFKALLESNASEQGARMTAMHKATDNAGEILKELNLQYNKARQASITNEILEIVGGAEALKG